MVESLTAKRSPDNSAAFWNLVVRSFRKNRMAVIGLVLLVITHVAAFIGPPLTGRAHVATDPFHTLQGPSAEHVLGTDEVGRDVLARLLHGARLSLVIAWFAVGLSVALGGLLGVVSGYFGGLLDSIIMRAADALMATPTFFVLLLALALFGSSVTTIIIVLGGTSWMGIARIVRSEVIRVRDLPYVEAARALGSNNGRIVSKHVFPQVIPAIIVASTIGVANAILIEASLSYLGLGVQPPLPALGNMLRNAQDYIFSAPALAVYPGALIMIIVLAYNWLGDGLRDALDPYKAR